MTDPLAPTGLVPDGFQTVAEQLKANAANCGDKPALISIEDGNSLTWKALHRLTTRLGHYLHGMGIDANDRVAVLGENSFENLILYYGVQAYGATYCTINIDVNRNHLIEMLDRIEPKVVFWQDDLDEMISDGPGTWIPYGTYDGQDKGLFALLAGMPDDTPLAPVNGLEEVSQVFPAIGVRIVRSDAVGLFVLCVYPGLPPGGGAVGVI